MSILIPRRMITSEMEEIIKSLLFLQPKEKYTGSQNSTPKPPILFYRIVEENGERHVALPYRFAVTLLKSNWNAEKSYTPSIFHFTGKLWERQISVVQEASDHLRDYGTTTLGLYPGFGKTILGAYLASKAGLLTIVLAHRETLLSQWKNTFSKVTNAKTWIVGDPMPALFNVIICLDKRIRKIDNDIIKRVGTMIIDEAHVFCTPSHVADLLKFQPRYIIAETATLKRDDDMDRMIMALCGPHQISRAMTKEFYVYRLDTGVKGTRESRKGGKGVNWGVLVKSLATNPHRNQLIVDIIEKNDDRKILVLTGLVDHVKELYRLLKEKGESVDYMCGTKKNYYDSRVLIGTISKIGTGFDEESFCQDYGGRRIDLAILAQSVAKPALLEQSVGRAFRAKLPNIVHLVDRDPTIERHWKRVASPWYKSRGGTIKVYIS